MTMLPILSVPEQPRWATDASTTTDPGETVKGTGAVQGTAMPAKWFNWLQNLNYQWTQTTMSTVLMNWFGNTDIAAYDIWSSIFHPDIGLWLVAGNSNLPLYSTDGYNWTVGNTLGGGAVSSYRLAGIDSTYYILGDVSSGDLLYSADAGTTAWNSVASATIGGAGNVVCIYTKYPDSDFAMICRGVAGTPDIRIASSGVTGAWVAATTQPPAPPAGSAGHTLLYTGSASTWMLLVNSAAGTGTATKLYKSTDDGDNWAAVAGMSQFPAASDGARYLAYNRFTGRLVVGGSISTGADEEYLGYSDDLGDNWTAATIDKQGIAASRRIDVVYYCGERTWVALADAYLEDSANTAYISTDDAVTWKVADFHEATSDTQLTTIACNERKILAAGISGFSASTLAV